MGRLNFIAMNIKALVFDKPNNLFCLGSVFSRPHRQPVKVFRGFGIDCLDFPATALQPLQGKISFAVNETNFPFDSKVNLCLPLQNSNANNRLLSVISFQDFFPLSWRLACNPKKRKP